MSSSDTPDDETVETPEPDELREGILRRLGEALGDDLIDSHIDPGVDMWARVSNDSWVHTAETLRYALGARAFGFISAIDWMPSPFGRSLDSEVDTKLADAAANDDDSAGDAAPAEIQHGVCGGETRMQVIARLGNLNDHWGITLKADVADENPSIATWVRVFAGADWHEREAWEMFGIDFIGHPALRNIYLPSGFEGHPLRKDFPLVARLIKPWPGIVDTEPMPASPDDDAQSAASSEEASA